jgi:hypothetical protein
MSSSLLRPATFEERGAIVPFTTPMLSLSRVRPDARERLVLMMPAFGSEQGSAFVAPWRNVPDLAKLSIHDRALHQEISLMEATTPERMRAAALKIARTGLAGPAAADAARRATETDRLRLGEIHKNLVRSLLSEFDPADTGLGVLDQPGEGWRAKVRPLLGKVGQAWGIEFNDLQSRIDLLSLLMVPVGLKVATRPGRLRILRDRFPRFQAAMVEWAEFEPTDLAALGTFAAAIAGGTLTLADNMLAPLDRSLRDIPLVIRDWAKLIKPIAQHVTRLGWLLDGWDFIFAFWDDVETAPIEEQREAIIRLLRVLPLVPRNEMESDEEELNRRHQQLQERQPQSNADWRTNRQEIDLASRIEEAKAKVMLA